MQIEFSLGGSVQHWLFSSFLSQSIYILINYFFLKFQGGEGESESESEDQYNNIHGKSFSFSSFRGRVKINTTIFINM